MSLHSVIGHERDGRPGANAATRPNISRLFWIALAGFLALRLIFSGLWQLAEDEAVYWSWSRHLAGCYMDHPPMIAWLIRGSTACLGTTEWGVRFFCPVMAAGSLAILFGLARRLFREPRAIRWMAALWLTSPLLAAFGTIATPDTPATFFSMCALGCAVVVFAEDQAERSPASDAALWLAFGAFCGLAMVSKYTTVLLPASVGLALLASPEGRRQLRKPWPWLSAAPALALFSPVIFWNHSHGWASFRFQLNHGLTSEHPSPVLGIARYLGGQLLIFTPVLSIIAIIVLVHFWRRYHALPASDRVLLWAATVPLAFFGYAATRSHGELNWPSFAYFPLSLLIVRWLSESWDPRRMGAVRNGCVVAAVGLVLTHVPTVWGPLLPAALRRPVMAKLDEMQGWRALGRRVDRLHQGQQIACELHQDAGEVAFYASGRPDAWPVGDGARTFAFEYFSNKPEFATLPRVLYVGFNYKWFARRYGFVVKDSERVVIPLATGGVRETLLVRLERAH